MFLKWMFSYVKKLKIEIDLICDCVFANLDSLFSNVDKKWCKFMQKYCIAYFPFHLYHGT